MRPHSLSHLSDPVLLRDLATLIARDRTTTAALLAHLAEVDARKLYLPAAYPSMYAYCVGELHMSEDAACRRIRAARAARQFPALFAALAKGRLHLSAVVLLAPHLTAENADQLLAAATHQNKSGIEAFLARRFPQPELPTRLESVGPAVQPPTQVGSSAPARMEPPTPGQAGDRPRVKPLAPERFALQVTIGQATHDKLRYAQALLGHQIAASDVAVVLDRALDALIHRLEQRKFAATAEPRPGHRRSPAEGRHIPAAVRRAVWARDGGQCTFVSTTGQRCPSRTLLEFDHVHEVARGGEASVSGIRLRCRAHNQYGAERTFGAEFMRHRRLAAAEARAAKARAAGSSTSVSRTAARAPAATTELVRIEAATTKPTPVRAAAAAEVEDRDVVPWLRQLGFSAAEARRGAARCADIPDASLEERVRVALSCFRVRGTRVIRAGETAAALAGAVSGRQ